jgi:adenylate kinase
MSYPSLNTSLIMTVFRLGTNLTLFGAPGSGKGYYGRLLSAAWQVPLYSASRILRSATAAGGVSFDLDSGRLVDCEIVAGILLDFLENQHLPTQQQQNSSQHHRYSSFFLMDGFPRTRQQIDQMNATWPKSLQIHAAFRLDVPDEVCVQKIRGRRMCRICHLEPNTADVRTEDGFILPPTRPGTCQNRCDPNTDWFRRPDDESTEIIAARILEYRKHEEPIVEYYEQAGELCSYRPLYGIQSMPEMQTKLQEWLIGAGMGDWMTKEA